MATIYGSTGSETINGTSENDILYGWARGGNADSPSGNDTLNGSLGDDILNGGTGNDSLLGSAGNDSLIGNDGNDVLTGGTRNDTLEGGAGADSLFGGAGNDILIGNAGNDVLEGNASNDALVGGLGRDILTGGDGADRFYFNSPDEGIDTITDFSFILDDEIWISAEGFGIDTDALDAITFNSITRALFVEDTQIATVPGFANFFVSNSTITLF
jgi:Ca2+-binding RTX toxin-like protein